MKMEKTFQKWSRRKLAGTVVPLTGLLLLSACSSVPKGDFSLDLGIKDRGVASWYGKEFHGKLAANGELFDMTAYTAAHRKLPLGTMIRVMNVHNGKSVQVRINDRGPYVAGRMLDLSRRRSRTGDGGCRHSVRPSRGGSGPSSGHAVAPADTSSGGGCLVEHERTSGRSIWSAWRRSAGSSASHAHVAARSHLRSTGATNRQHVGRRPYCS